MSTSPGQPAPLTSTTEAATARRRGRKLGVPNTIPGRRSTDTEWKCNRCTKVKPVAEFPVAANKPSGRHCYCNPCMAAVSQIRRDRRKLAAVLLDELEKQDAAAPIEVPVVQELLAKWREVNQVIENENH